MTLGELIAEYRSLSGDKRRPYLCDDAEATKWFNEAQDEAAIRSRLLVASEEISFDAGTPNQLIPSGMFEISAAELVDANGKRYVIEARTSGELDIVRPGWRRSVERPEFFVIEDTAIVLGSVPDAAYTLCVEGYRTPDRVLKNENDIPAIHRTHHSGLIAWVMYKAFGKRDADLFDPDRSAESEAAFTRQFGKRPNANLRKRQNANRPHHNRVHL